MSKLGTVYLICFDQRYHHCKHYIGWCEGDVEDRLARHRRSDGARLLRALNLAGIGYKIVRTWKNVDRHFERRLKNQKNSKRFCPLCGKEGL